MSILSRPLTYDDLLREREIRDERLRLELIEGEIVMTPSPATMHQIVVHRLAVLLDRAIVESDLGVVLEAPYDVYLDEQNVLQPDVVVVLRDRLPMLGAAKLESAPSLAVEIISPSTATRDRITKRNVYARNGVPEYWLIDIDRGRVTIFSDPRDGRYRTEETTSHVAISTTIPALSVDLRKLFAPIFGA